MVFSLSSPEILDDLLSNRRHEIVLQIATQITNGVHAHNQFLITAQGMGFGVRPYNPNDPHGISGEVVKDKLTQNFPAYYTFFSTINALQEQLLSLVRDQGYEGKRETGYEYDVYKKFEDALKPFVNIYFHDLFILKEDIDDEAIIDLNWINIKRALLKKLRDEQIFIFDQHEEALLNYLLDNTNTLDLIPPCDSLFSNVDEFIACFIFFKEWPAEKKSKFFFNHLKDKAPEIQKMILEKLEKIPEFIAELKANPQMQHYYFQFSIDAHKINKLREYIEHGADLNIALPLLLSNDKSATLYWLHNNPKLLATINQEGMNALISEGQDKGKSVAEIIILSKKGRQILFENEKLQALCPRNSAGKSIAAWMKQVPDEKKNISYLFFTPIGPLVTKLLRHVIKGEQTEAEDIIKQNPFLLLEKGKVIDYSGRKIYGTALQMALGAEDVRHHEDEECMVEMIQKYLKNLQNGESIIAKQTKDQFPEGWQKLEKERAKRDSEALRKVIQAIANAGPNDNCEEALQIFREYLKPKGIIKAGKHFNALLLLEAFELYNKNYTNFCGVGGYKNALFWSKVIGYIQRYCPSCYAQVFCQGIEKITFNKKKLKRKLNFHYSDDVFFPLDLNPLRLGYDFGGWRYATSRSRPDWITNTNRVRTKAAFLQNLYDTKIINLRNYIAEANMVKPVGHNFIK